MKKTDEAYYMRAALQKARRGIRAGQTPFGACIVKNGRIITCAHNRVWKTGDITAHAEMVAIRRACRKLKTIDLSGCVLYSTCEPCPMCFSAAHWARIKKIVYGACIADAKKAGFRELCISSAAMKKAGRSGMRIRKDFLRNDARVLFKEWRMRAGAKVY
jgi:tRNA(Arg) A34 adenosine deaminase TadA